MRGWVEGIAAESALLSDNEQYYARLSDGNIVLLDKDPNFGDKTVDSDSDGICDIDELGVKTKIPVFDPASNKNLLLEARTFKSNPVAKDTDGDGILDAYDVEPLIYNFVVVEEDDDHITFNTGNEWYKVKSDGDSALDDAFAGATKGGSKLPLKMNLQFFAKKGGRNSTGVVLMHSERIFGR